VVFHLGAMLGPACDSAPQAGIQANAMGTYHILEAARIFGARQVVFASSISVMSGSFPEQQSIDDNCPSRPTTVYGAAKLFSESLGLTYKRLHGLDFRALRLPALIGPGARSQGYAEWFNKVIEESVLGRPYSIFVAPHTQMDIIHVKDAARAFLELAAAPQEQMKTVNYIVIGPTPRPSAQELVDLVRAKIPGAKLEFNVDENIQKLVDHALRLPLDDRYARQEWGWRHAYDLNATLDDFRANLG
jgi:nucleoside-diphosphate-sugar epimerase